MTEIGVGIVGAGWVAGEHIRSFNMHPHSRVAGICSRTREGAEAKARACGLTDVNIYESYAEMLADPGIGAVSLCSPPNLHPEQTILAAEAGKHILIEKAAANDPLSLGRMLAAVESANVRTLVSFVLHWNPQFIWIRRMMEQSSIGKVFYAEADYWHNIGPHYAQYRWNIKKEIAGSSFLSAGIHAVDALRWFLQDEIEEVSAYQVQTNPDYEYPTTCVGVVKFRGGAVGKLSSCLDNKCPYTFNIDLLGDKGAIRDNRIFAAELFPGATDWVEVPTIRPDSGDVTHHPFDGEIADFVESILAGKDAELSLADAAHTHAVAFALDRSASEGRPVQLKEIWQHIKSAG
jgi:predicted dehydrogenase